MSKAAVSIAYEPFGERLDLCDAAPAPASRGRKRAVGIVLFWTFAAVLVVARISLSDPASAPSLAASDALASAPQGVVIR